MCFALAVGVDPELDATIVEVFVLQRLDRQSTQGRSHVVEPVTVGIVTHKWWLAPFPKSSR